VPTPWEQGFVEVADRCFVARYREWDVSVGVLLGSGGALVVDTRASLVQGQVVYDDVRRLPGRPEVQWVVNTHEHFDHVLGNGAFPGAAGYAHENAVAGIAEAAAWVKQQIAADPGLDPEHPEITGEVLEQVMDTVPVLPQHTFSSATTIDLGDRYVELLYPGRGHTGGDLVVLVPDADVMFAGDLIEESADRDATPGFGSDCFPLEWAGSLDLMIGMLGLSTSVVPGHGAVVDRSFVERQREDVSQVAQLIRSLAGAGVPVEEALREGERAGGWPFDARYLEQAVSRGYQHLAVDG
jgi:glyoxylase-like metal-dependent hydrolase (beta-lactamase superfamily II)